MKRYWVLQDNADPSKYAVVGSNRRPKNAICPAPEGATTLDSKYITVSDVLDEDGETVIGKQATLDQAQKDADEAAKAAAEAADAPRKAVESAIRASMKKGNDLIEKFAVENVMLGITSDGMTGQVLDVMAPVSEALRSGSLYEAIDRIKAIAPEDKDAKYVTDARLLSAVNELETFLGVDLSLTL